MKNKINKIAICQTDGTTKCYVDINDFKREIKSRDSKIKNLELKLEKKKYKVGDEVKWCNFDWIVIKTIKDEQEVVLMSKEVFEPMTYSDSNSNNYVESNVKEYLEECFINKLDKSKLIEMRTNYDEDKFVTTKVRIPTIRDIEALPMSIRNCGSYYWTMTGSYAKSEDSSHAVVFFVDSYGFLNNNPVHNTYGLRPVITLSTETL
jgi:hypothetical protein